ncbi:MAG: tyrosine-type recombinase/integrase [Crocinitomicaceae bacterium]|nr:tyrosine-type recombinase/integrase [Crocinitomicaceae bacterium]
MTFEEYLRQFYADETIRSYMYIIDTFRKNCRNADNLGYKGILNYISKHNLRSYAQLSALKKYFDYLIDIHVREDHPCASIVVKHPSQVVQFQDLFSIEELELLLKIDFRYKQIKRRNKSILSLLIYQGLTPTNIANIRLRDLILEEGSLYIRQTPKVRKRLLMLHEKQLDFLQLYLKKERNKLVKDQTDKLFLTQNANDFSPEALNRLLRPLKALYPSKNLTALAIRQSVISNWINGQHLSIEQVQTLSGQKWLSTTEKYKRKNMHERVKTINTYFPDIA